MPRNRTRATLEAGEKLNINALVRGGFIGGIGSHCFVIEYGTGLRVIGTIENFGGVHRLHLRHQSGEQFIWLEAAPRHFGGVQWYFTCPKTSRRVSMLWRPPGATTFASRHAWRRRVGYASQFLDPIDRAWRSKRTVARQLGSTDPNDYDLPSKPLWMRWATYNRLADRYWQAEDRLEMLVGNALAAFVRRHGDVI